jgi:hypothetical protein
MGEFRIGRKYAHHFYPDTPRGAGALSLARNFAMGPGDPTDVVTAGDGGTQIPWDFIESDGPLGVDVPITPRVTGQILFKGVVVVKNNSLSPVNVTVQVEIDDLTLFAPVLQETVTANGLAAIPFEALTFTPIPIGVLATVQVILTASVNDAITLNVDGSTIEIEEVLPATS